MKKAALILMLLSIITKIVGFAREIVLSYFYGTSSISDAYLISLTIPTVIFAFIGVAIKTTYMPMYSRIEKAKGNRNAEMFTNNVINILLVISTFIILAVLLWTEPLIKLFASGFDGETLEIAKSLTRVTIVSIYFTGIIYIAEGYLQLRKCFIVPALIGLPLNVFLILSIVFSTKLGFHFLAYGKILAVMAQLALVVPFLYRQGYKHVFIANIGDKNIKKLFFLSLPVMMGTSVNQINKLVDRTIASQVAIGGISALNYATRLNSFVQGIFIMSVATVLYASITKMAADKDILRLKKSLSESINVIILLVLPTTFGAMLFAKPIVTLLFGRGAFDTQAIEMTSDALFFYSIGMLGYGLREVLARVFYSLQDTKTPMINASIGMVLNIILNIILSRYFGIGGLALATSISAIFTTGLMFISLRKKIGVFGMKQISISFLKFIVASLVMSLLAKLSFYYLMTMLNQNLSLMIAIVIGGLVYFNMIYFMKVNEVDILVNIVKKKFIKSKV